MKANRPIKLAIKIMAHSERVGIASGVTIAGPPGSTMVPLASKSWSPAPPSVKVSVTLMRSDANTARLAANWYQWSVGFAAVLPYFI